MFLFQIEGTENGSHQMIVNEPTCAQQGKRLQSLPTCSASPQITPERHKTTFGRRKNGNENVKQLAYYPERHSATILEQAQQSLAPNQ